MNLEYAVLIEVLPATEGGGYLATVPELPGCMSDGDTPEEALRNVQDAIVSWMTSATEWKQDIPIATRPPLREGGTNTGVKSSNMIVERAVNVLDAMPEEMRERAVAYLVEQAEKYRWLKEEIDKGLADVEAGRVQEWNYGDLLKRAKLARRDD